MKYGYAILGIIIFILAVRLFFLKRAVRAAVIQMEEIEKQPESNRQLKGLPSTDTGFEKLLKRINDIYRARQKERITYQRRETQIRREIENISHDLRTPLTSIIGYAELIKDEQTTEAEKREYIDIIQKRARLLQGFIQDFYEIARIEGEDYPLLLTSVPVQNTISEVIVAYYNEFTKNSIEVTVELSEKQCSIIADLIQFNRILNNLVQNALKYAHKRFIVKQYSEDGECIIKFINETSGMNEEELKHVFDRFYTGDSSRGSQSTGLGLTITKLLVEKMKGIINAELENNIFVIELRWRMK